MPETLDPGTPTITPPVSPGGGVERRRSRNPLKNMMQHLTVDPPPEDDVREPRRASLIRRISWGRKSRSPSAHSDRSGGQPQDPNLCTACAGWAADIDSTFDTMDDFFTRGLNPTSADTLENKESTLGRLKDLEENRFMTKCPLCKLFLSVHIPSEGEGDLYLSGFSARDTNYLIDYHTMFDQGHSSKNKIKGVSPSFLGVVPKKSGDGALSWDVSADWFRGSGMLYRTFPEAAPTNELLSARSEGRHSRANSISGDNSGWQKKGIWGRELETMIDMGIGQDWLRFCEFYHQGRCGRRPIGREMPGFKLVDCAKNPPQVVTASISERYAALSYVWGGNTKTDTWPKVVWDAVIASKDLGIRYLWVDRLCMEQLQPVERATQIARMDEIFEGAILAIIAACGEDADYGLPGVGSRARQQQPKYEFVNSNITLVSSLPDPRIAIKDSKWYQRGWTYQEGLLARRRLIFTDQQMYWECEGMCCPESLILPLEFYHDMEEQRMCDFMRPGLFNGVSFVDGSWERWKRLPGKAEEPSTLSIFREADQHIVNYTKRDLTYDQDSLNAFLGMLRRLETTVGRGKMFNILGVPLWAPQGDQGPAVTGLPRTRDIFALSTCFWHHKEGVIATRRPHMPSWTWAGWKGPVDLYSSITVVDPDSKAIQRKYNHHHYVSATHVSRNDPNSIRWTYSPNLVLVNRDGSVAYDFGASSAVTGMPPAPPNLHLRPYGIHVPNPFVLDRVKARSHPDGWIFNRVSVDVRMSRGAVSMREYIERHARGEQMSVLWFVEEALVMLLVVERVEREGRIVWERVGRMRMGFPEEAREVVKRCGRLENLVAELPLRRLGEDIVIE
ncbi:heterokaryon incompatibility protein-domain-containing protein [Fusarium flagelliforme]|uniref:Tol protein n=1 Tax=Fusarium flagelliforme TaxID=2675880 RepID=A0A395N493_9HYPO|nr:heterokaryon incompatibility protein-domain-containing protein [Fusarium flagelliforme]KAH7182535.1 heterokaryon incompatibility protein-domain-containing protein [Fusarium flagelliforme]RFN54707.1 tol protein [Fusarium flagelliforme]